MQRRGAPPPRGFRDRPFPPRPPPDYYDEFDHRPPPSPPWEHRNHFGHPPSPPPPPGRPPRFWDDQPTPPPPWARDDGPSRSGPWDKDYPPSRSFADDDFDVPPPPPPYPSNGPPRGRGRGSDGRGGNRGRGLAGGRGEASSRGTVTPRGANQTRGASARGASNGRGANSARGAPSSSRGAPNRGGPKRGAPNRGARGGTSTSRGASNGNGAANGRGTAKWLSNVRGGNSGRGGSTVPGTVGNTNSNQSTPGTNVTKPNNQNSTTTPVSKAGQVNHTNYYSAKQKEKSTVVKAAIPGQLNFISFKNSLQECCQKQQLPVPSYTTWKNSFGYSAKVEVANNIFKSAGIQGDRKEAEQGAAYTALINLGLIDSSVKFDVKTAAVIKRPAIDNSMTDSSGKRFKLDPTCTVATSFKSRLNEFCQKFRLSIPSYDTEKVENGKGFITTVVFNNKVYKSNGPQTTKKQAEQNAAQVVLHMLNQCPPPAPSFNDYIEQCRQLTSSQNKTTESSSSVTSTATVSTTTNATVEQISTAAVPNISTPSVQHSSIPTVQKISAPVSAPSEPLAAAKPTMFTSHKNKLQEYCQKSRLDMPVYSSNRENGVFTCTVKVAGSAYTSSGCNTKKGSEQTAANVALKALGIV